MFVKPVFRSLYELCNTDLKVGYEEADITGVLAANEQEFFQRLRGWALFVKDNTIGIQVGFFPQFLLSHCLLKVYFVS